MPVNSDNLDSDYLKGGTDDTKIGNTGDRLRVDAAFSSITTTVPSWSKKLRYDDMNATTGGIARGTNVSGVGFATVYSYSGSGFLAGLILNVEGFSEWTFQLEVDGDIIFTLLAADLTGDSLYDVDDTVDFNEAFIGLSKSSHDRFVWHPPLNSPVYYGTSVVVKLKKTGTAKKFQAGLVVLSKET